MGGGESEWESWSRRADVGSDGGGGCCSEVRDPATCNPKIHSTSIHRTVNL